ncbi:hypothetical protein NW762_006916 [Fusarium torreyae]|uniref:Uncharacterized protein n=1 Tax=Fusarium torreyae TaxID=1237075 RepID=A0A9W8S014_9HYPO|nr:hypothetical protein NW762_006916 [Fusarium torreyae]
MRSPISLLILLCALISVSFAVDVVRLSDNRAPTSQFATHGVASQLPCRDRAIQAQERARQAAMSQMLGTNTLKVSIVEAASVNVKAFAHGGISFLFGLASSSNDVFDYINNGTTSVFSRSEPTEAGSAASGRKHVAYTSIALVLVMLFFAVWM